jgi:hypothetical protein
VVLTADPVEVGFFRMKIVKAGFKLYHQEDQQAGSHANGKTQHINECIGFISTQVPECRL